MEKKCLKCGETNNPEGLVKDKTREDGFHPYCKKCNIKKVKEYTIRNNKKVLDCKREYYQKNKNRWVYYRIENKDRINKLAKVRRKEKPWIATYYCIRQRCKSKDSYFKFNIKPIITKEDLKILWYRDKAYELKKPSIDRIDNEGDYVFHNCRYIEMDINIKRERRKRGNSITTKTRLATLAKEKKDDYKTKGQ
jgi:hypothetical protein